MEQERRALLVGALWILAAVLVLFAAWCGPDPASAGSDGPYSPGDTLWFSVAALDSIGVDELPDTAAVVLSYGTQTIDVLTYPTPDGDLEQVGSLDHLRGMVVIPDTWTHPWTLEIDAYGTVDGFAWGHIITDPSRVRVNARSASVGTVDSSGVVAALTEAFPDSMRVVASAIALVEPFPAPPDSIRAVGIAYQLDEEISVGFDGGFIDSVGLVLELDEEITATSAVVDTIAPSAVEDFFAGLASATSAFIDQDSCDDCLLEVSGSVVSDAFVYVWSDSVATALDGRLRGFTPFVTAGNWRAQVRLEPGVPDTMWVRFFRQGAFLPTAHRVIIP